MKKLFLFVSIFLLAILFTGCVTILSSDTAVKLDESEKWEINQNILIEGDSYSQYSQTVTDGLDTLVADGKKSGIDITYKKLSNIGSNVPYSIIIKGTGLDKLNETLGLSENGTPVFNKVTVNGETAYGFQMDAVSLSSGGLTLGLAPEFKFTIEGMKVLETNGKKSGNSVTWQNPKTPMTATLVPASSGGGIAWWVILLIVVVLAGVALVILLITGVFKKKQPQPQQQYYYPSGYGTPATPPPAPSAMPPAVPPASPYAPVNPPPSPQAYQPVMPPPAQPPYQPVVPPPQPVPPAPQAPAAPPSSGSMETIIAPRKAAKEESTGEETIMVQHVAPKPPAAPDAPAQPPPGESKP